MPHTREIKWMWRYPDIRRKAGGSTGRNVREWENKSKCTSPLLLTASALSQFVAICYQRYQHKLHNRMCYRHTHTMNAKGSGSALCMYSPIVCTLLPSSSKQALNQRKHIAWGISAPVISISLVQNSEESWGLQLGTRIRISLQK